MDVSHYEELSMEEESDAGRSKVPTSLRRVLFSIWTLLVLLIIASSIAVSISTPWTEGGATSPDDPLEWNRAHTSRATGDQYLLGIGKADITGFVSSSGQSMNAWLT
jgi:hypothetical protein